MDGWLLKMIFAKIIICVQNNVHSNVFDGWDFVFALLTSFLEVHFHSCEAAESLEYFNAASVSQIFTYTFSMSFS